MGIVFRGIPPELALRLKKEYKLDVFIETGSLVGNTAKWAAAHFDAVYTIEAAYKYYIRTKMTVKPYSNVQVIHGYSSDVLHGLLDSMNQRCLIWLDAHWSSDLGYRQSPDTLCPVLKELREIDTYDIGHIILIDDVRLFGIESGWPDVRKIETTLESMGKIVTQETDVFVAVPK